VVAISKLVLQSGYREEDASDALGRIISFFNDHLTEAAPPPD
jgi:hypothetical protein